MGELRFEKLKNQYLPQILEIYNFYVSNTTATFHTHPLSSQAMRELVFFDNPRYQTYMIIHEHELCGYVLLTRHKQREAYDDTAEVTIYLRPESTKQGFGSEALQFIEKIASEKRFHALVATICGENLPSIRLFEKNGYFRCAHFREVGQKFGRYLDLVAYQKILGSIKDETV